MDIKYNLILQCPQLYIYILGWIVDFFHSYKIGTKGDMIRSILSGIISVIFLMYINYCKWGKYQWVTTVHATLVVIVILMKLLSIYFYEEIKKEINKVEETK